MRMQPLAVHVSIRAAATVAIQRTSNVKLGGVFFRFLDGSGQRAAAARSSAALV
jgi:hypothetical protein